MSLESLTRVLILIPIGLICVYAFQRLLPRLAPAAKRLAIGLLLAQLIVICLALTIQPDTSFEVYLWELRQEWNIPSTLAFTQLAVVGSVAILAGWSRSKQHIPLRTYLVCVGLLFLFLAWDEYVQIHEKIPYWEGYYALLGVVVALAAILIARRSARSLRFWFWPFLVGLALSATGTIVFERLTHICEIIAHIPGAVCENIFVWEETFEFIGIWIVLVATLGLFCELRQPLSKASRIVLYCLPPLLLIGLTCYSFFPRLELRALALPTSVEFQSDIRLIGFRLEEELKPGDSALAVQLFTTAKQMDYFWLGYSLHLVDQQHAESVAHVNEPADRKHSFWPLGPNFKAVYRHEYAIPISAQIEPNRAMWIALTLWRNQADKFPPQPISASQLYQLSDTHVVLGEAVLEATPAGAPAVTPLALFDHGLTLQDVDYPAQARAGDDLLVTMAWRADSAGMDDLIQFLHLGHEETGEWFVYDQQPLSARLPTRLWYTGLAESEIWRVPLPSDLAAGRYAVFTGLYRDSDKERLIARDTNGESFLDARVPLGSLLVDAS